MSLVQNKKARLNYEILETFTSGVELFGFEVKSVKSSLGSLEGSHVIIRGGEAYLVEAEIPAFQKANAPEMFDPRRPRRLLFTKKEISQIQVETEKKGISAIPLNLFLKGRLIKVDVALVRGKKKFDKRETIKKKDVTREIEREMKRGR